MTSELGDRVRFALELVSTYSPSGEEDGVTRLLAERLNSQGLNARVDSVGNVISEVGVGERVVLLCGHMDTVAGWVEPRLVDGVLHGRGAVDAKGALLSLLYAFEDYACESERSRELGDRLKVVFAGVVQEEGDSRGVKKLVEDGLRADAAVFGEPSSLSGLAVGYRGHVPLKVCFETPEAHASAPWLTTNSAEVAYKFYEELKRVWSCSSDKLVECVSVALTGVNTTTPHNVIPGKTVLNLDIRVPVGLSTAHVAEAVHSVISKYNTGSVRVSHEFGELTEPYRVSLTSRIVRSFSRAFIKRGLGRPTLIVKSGTGDMNTYAHAVHAECVSYGPGDPKLSHTAVEHVGLNDVLRGSQIVLSALLEYLTLAS
ncbi:MAG: M20/M25/M40 family metallo-hydrolase [Thermoprotei archaeon]